MTRRSHNSSSSASAAADWGESWVTSMAVGSFTSGCSSTAASGSEASFDESSIVVSPCSASSLMNPSCTVSMLTSSSMFMSTFSGGFVSVDLFMAAVDIVMLRFTACEERAVA